MISYQSTDPGEPTAVLKEHEKLFDGSVRYRSHMSENDIRQEIARVIRLKTDTQANYCIKTRVHWSAYPRPATQLLLSATHN